MALNARSDIMKARVDKIVTHAWETWTKNGLNLDADMREETAKTVKDAVNNTWHLGISDLDWLTDTMKRLNGQPKV